MSYPGLLLLTTVALLSAGCSDPTEVSFAAPRKVSRDQRPTTWDAPTRDRLGMREMDKASAHDAGQQEPSQERWTGTTPSGWEELAPQRFRELNWRVAGNGEAECYLSVGVGGGVAANLKRWYTAQNGIQDVPALESLPVVEIAGRKGHLVELTPAPGGKTTMIAFFADGAQVTSLKFTGPEVVAKQQREPFLALAKSLRMETERPTETGPRTTTNPTRNAPANDQARGEKAWTGTTPNGWEELAPQRFRELNWRVAGNRETECYLSVAVGGGVAGNMTRWYSQQFGIADVPKPEALPEVEIAGRQGRLVELAGTYNEKPGMAMLLAFFADGAQLTTLKLTGPEAIVKQNREPFLALAKSLRMQAAGPEPAGAQGTPEKTPAPSIHSTQKSGGTGAFTATVPAGWTVKTPSNRMLHYTFGSEGEVYMSQLGGTLRPTLDIWRGELGLPALSDSEFQALPKVSMLGGDATLLDAAGNFQSMSGKQIPGARVLIAAQVEGTAIVFVKLVGKAAEVEAQREALLQFLATLRRTP